MLLIFMLMQLLITDQHFEQFCFSIHLKTNFEREQRQMIFKKSFLDLYILSNQKLLNIS